MLLQLLQQYYGKGNQNELLTRVFCEGLPHNINPVHEWLIESEVQNTFGKVNQWEVN